MRTTRKYIGGISPTTDFVINKPITVVPKVIESFIDDDGNVQHNLDNGITMTASRYEAMFGRPLIKGEIKPKNHKGDNPDRTKINFKK